MNKTKDMLDFEVIMRANKIPYLNFEDYEIDEDYIDSETDTAFRAWKIGRLAQGVKNEAELLNKREELVREAVKVATNLYVVNPRVVLVGLGGELKELVRSIKDEDLNKFTTARIVANYMGYYMEARGYARSAS